MAAIQFYQNGAGGTTGADLAVLKPAYMSGNFWYVKASTGTDAASPAGKERNAPLATLAQAYTNAVAGDTIVLLSGHAESLGAAQVINKVGLAIVSEGTGLSRATFTCTGAVAMFDITSAGVTVDNIYFPASSAAPTARIRSAAAFTRIANCTFECGASDTTRAVRFITGAADGRITGTTFTSVAATPGSAIEVLNAMVGLEMDNVTFDGGSFGWSAAAFLGTAAVTALSATRMHRLNGSDVVLATASAGRWFDGTVTADSRVDWTA
jgi:hypothetical protein